MKTCRVCQRAKPFNDFYRRKDTKDGYANLCKKCHRDEVQCNEQRRRAVDSRGENDKANASRNARHAALRQETLDAYGRRCACPGCTETHAIFLDLDHVDGRTAIDKKRNKSSGVGSSITGASMYAIAKREEWPDRFRLLCSNCNRAYHRLGTCPHLQEVMPPP